MNHKQFSAEVVGFGALNLDQLHQVEHIAGADEEIFIKNVQEFCGGSAANTIIGLSKLGIKTGYIGKIAQDREGEILKNNLKKEKVDLSSLIISSEGRTGRVLGFVDPHGQRALYVDPGVNDDISLSEIKLDYVNQSQVLHLSSFVGDSFQTQKKLLSELDDDLTLSFDPGSIYVKRGQRALEKILKRTQILLINERELMILGEETYTSYQEGASELIRLGIEVVVVKRGERGVYANNGIEEVELEAFPVRCVDTTGAGDAFNAGFLYAQLKKSSLEESCRIGNLLASKCIQKLGATTGLSTSILAENHSNSHKY